MGTFFDSFMPALTGAVAQAPLAGAQGHLQGLQAITELARLQSQIQQQNLAMQQSRQQFPLQQQQLQQQLKLNAAPQWQARQPGTTLEQIDPLTGGTTGAARQIPLNPLQEAQAKLYSGSGLYPPGSIEEAMKRRLAADPDDQMAGQYFAAIQRNKALAQGVTGPYDQQTIMTEAERAAMDPNYHPQFSGPYGPANRQAFDKALANPRSAPGQATPGRASQIIGQQADTKLLRETVSAFGPHGKQGNEVRSFNTALNHLETLDRLASALNNKDIQGYNRIANAWAKQVGAVAPASWDAAVKVVGDELAKAIVGAGVTAAGDREEIAHAVSSNLTPAQWASKGGVSDTYKDLMTGKISELQRMYEGGGGRDFGKFLSPTAAKIQKDMTQRKNEDYFPGGTSAKPPAKAAQQSSGVPTIKNDDEYNKLPAGSEFIGPDGKKRKKP